MYFLKLMLLGCVWFLGAFESVNAQNFQSVKGSKVTVECIEANEIKYPSYQFPAEKPWLKTLPNDGGFENRKPLSAGFTQVKLNPDIGNSPVCSSENVNPELMTSIDIELNQSCYNATLKYGFLPNSNKFVLLQDVVRVNTYLNKERTTLRFWMAAECENCQVPILLAGVTPNLGKVVIVDIDNTTCATTGRWKRYTVFLGDHLAELMKETETNSLIELTEEIFKDVGLSDIDRGALFSSFQLADFYSTLWIGFGLPTSIAIDNIEVIGGIASENATFRPAAAITEIEISGGDEGYFKHLEKTPIDACFFAVFSIVCISAIFIIIGDIRKKVTSRTVSRFVNVWLVVAVAVSVYAIVELQNFIKASDDIEAKTTQIAKDLDKALENSLLPELLEQTNGVEPYGFVLQDLKSIASLPALFDLIETNFDFVPSSEWTELQSKDVANTCPAVSFNSKYLCFENDNCIYNTSGASKFESYQPTNCIFNCSIYSSYSCSQTVSTNGTTSIVTSTDCPLQEDADYGFCSSFQELKKAVYETNETLNQSPDVSISFSVGGGSKALENLVGFSFVSGPVILTQEHITTLLFFSFGAGVVFSVIEFSLFLALSFKRINSSRKMLVFAAAVEAFNIVTLLISLGLSASITYYVVNEPVRVNIEDSGLLLDFSIAKIFNASEQTPLNEDDLTYFSIPLRIKPDAIRWEESTFRPVLDVPFNTISECYTISPVNAEMPFILNYFPYLRDSVRPSFDSSYQESELCDFDNIEVIQPGENTTCVSISCSDGVFPLTTEKAVDDRIDFLFVNVVYGVLILDVFITFIDVLVMILSVRYLHSLHLASKLDTETTDIKAKEAI